MPFFKQRKPKRFNYTPRSEKESNKHEADRMKSQWEHLRVRGKAKPKFKTLPFLLVILGMIIAIWYLLIHYETF